MIQPTILWQGNIEASQLQISLVDAIDSNRKIDPTVENQLQGLWAVKKVEAREHDQILYDGTSYRLETFIRNGDCLSITVSPIKFSVRSTLKKRPELDFLGEGYYSHGLSIGGFVLTSDGQYVFAQKSSRVTSSLREDVIGGVLEEIDPVSGIGVLNMNMKEIKEEINVDHTIIEDMRILGLVRSSSTDVVIITSTRLRITSVELMEIFDAREDQELEGMVIVDPENLISYLNTLGGYKPLLIDLI